MLGGNAAIRRKLVDGVRQFLTKTLQQLLSRHAGLAREPVDFFRAQRFLEFGRPDWLVRAAANPRLRDVAQTVLLKLPKKIGQPVAQYTPRAAATAQEAAEQPANTTRRRRCGLPGGWAW